MPIILEPLRIISPDRKSWIEMRPLKDYGGGMIVAEFEASVDYGHGRFTALNTDVIFHRLTEFSSEFDKFITQRSLTPRLFGTYYCLLEFTGIGSQASVSFCVGDAYCGGPHGTEEPRLRGQFIIDSERLNDLNTYFKRWAIVDSSTQER